MTDKITFTVGGEKHVLPIDSSKTLRVGSVSPSVEMEVEEVAMSDIKQKALALVNEVEGGNWLPHETDRIRNFATICHAIKQHEAFRQEVSDAVERAVADCGHDELRKAYVHARFFHFIIAKPDPLVDAWQMAFPGNHIDDARDECAKISAAIEARGGRIVWEGE